MPNSGPVTEYPASLDESGAEAISATETRNAPSEPANPRSAPDVLNALMRAARRDPHRDVFKPIGRISFVISLVVLAWLARPAIEPQSVNLHLRGNEPLVVVSRGVAIFEHLTHALLSISWRKLIHLDLDPKQVSLLMLAGLFGFGFYYFSVYLVAMNALRFTAGVGTIADQTMRRARRIARRVRESDAVEVRTPPSKAPGADDHADEAAS